MAFLNLAFIKNRHACAILSISMVRSFLCSFAIDVWWHLVNLTLDFYCKRLHYALIERPLLIVCHKNCKYKLFLLFILLPMSRQLVWLHSRSLEITTIHLTKLVVHLWKHYIHLLLPCLWCMLHNLSENHVLRIYVETFVLHIRRCRHLEHHMGFLSDWCRQSATELVPRARTMLRFPLQ